MEPPLQTLLQMGHKHKVNKKGKKKASFPVAPTLMLPPFDIMLSHQVTWQSECTYTDNNIELEEIGPFLILDS